MKRSSPWLRLCALGASAATLVAVVSGAAGWNAAHQLLSALALPPLVAVALAAWLGHRRLLVPALVSIALFGLAALITVPGLHLAARPSRSRPRSSSRRSSTATEARRSAPGRTT